MANSWVFFKDLLNVFLQLSQVLLVNVRFLSIHEEINFIRYNLGNQNTVYGSCCIGVIKTMYLLFQEILDE